MNMRKWKQCSTFAAFGLFAFLSGHSFAGTTDAVWTSRFGSITGGVQPAPYDAPRIMAGPSGHTFAYGFVESGRLGPGVVRFGGDINTPDWSAISPSIEDYATSRAELIPLPDGSVIHHSITLSRFAPDGSLVWSIPKGNLAAVVRLTSGDLLAVSHGAGGQPGSIRVLSLATGATIDAVPGGSCQYFKVATFAPDLAYVTGNCPQGRVTKLRTNPLRIEWTSPPDDVWIGVPVGALADAAGIYVASTDLLRKYSAVDGQVLWDAVPVSAPFNDLAHDGSGNVVTSGAAIDLWNGTTGVNLWHYVESAVARVDPALNAVFFAGSVAPEFLGDGFNGFAGRLDLSDGDVAWRRETPSGSNINFFDTAIAGDTLQVTGQDCTAPHNGSCTTLLWSTDAATGSAFQSAPLVSKTGTSASITLEEGDRTLAAALEWTVTGPQIHLRSHANATGAILQESVTPIPSTTRPWSSRHRLHVVRSGDGNIVATYGNAETGGASDIFFDATILKIDVATGQLLWQVFLVDTSTLQASAYISAPAADQEGNIAIGVLETFWAEFPNRRWVRKFNHVSGELIWERELQVDPTSVSAYLTPGVTALGAHVASETPLGEASAGLTSLSGVDGTTVWTSSVITGRLFPLDASTAISYWHDASQILVHRFNLNTGALLWTSAYSDPSDTSYSVSGAARGEQDDFYIGGTYRQASLTANGLLIRVDLANGNIVWAKRLVQGPVDTRSRVNPRIVHDGKIFATQPFFHTYGYALSGFSTADGSHTGSAYLYSSPLDHPHLPQHADSGILGKTSTGQLMVAGHHSDPGLPIEFVHANWGSPLPGPIGALRVSLDIEPTSVSTAITYAYAFVTTNEGSVTANNVRALLSLPAGTIVESATCQLAGSSCVATTTATSIEGGFTIPPGATLRIEGTVKLLPANDSSSSEVFVASAFAPHTFAELDLKDNVAYGRGVELIFRNGFDQ